MNKIKDRYSLLKIDVTDTVPFADFFDDDRYAGFQNSKNLEELLDIAVIGFWKLNPNMKTYNDWETRAENGGFDFQIIADKKIVFRSSLMLADPRIMGAIFLIRNHHSNQTRKGDGFAYLEHPLEVGYRLWRDHFPGDVVAAGFCHDLLEDTKCTESEIEEKCGKDVLNLVKAVSNDGTLSDNKDWEKKKQKYIETVKKNGNKAIAISVMDKICNLYSFFDQYETEGSALWKKFNRGKDKKLWFEKAVYEMAKGQINPTLLKELDSLIQRLEKTE